MNTLGTSVMVLKKGRPAEVRQSGAVVSLCEAESLGDHRLREQLVPANSSESCQTTETLPSC